MISKEGYMYKKGKKKLRIWRRRFFIIMDGQLQYFKAPGLPPKGAIPITSPDMVELAPECKRQPAFKITADKKKVRYFCTESIEEANSWVEALRRTARGLDVNPIHSFNDLELVRTLVSKPNNARIDLVKVRGTSVTCVLKRYPRALFEDPNSVIYEKSEFLNLMNPFVTPLLKLLQDGNELGFVLEYAKNGCLFGYLWEIGKFSEAQVAMYAAELAVGLAFMHRKGVVYGDLSPTSVLLGGDGHVMLPVPGMFPDMKTVTPYLAPEVVSGQRPEQAADWYGIGTIIYEMLTGMPPFWGENEEELRVAILKDPLMFPYHVSDSARDIVRKLMAREPEDRISMEGLSEHPFFEGIAWTDVSAKKSVPKLVPDDKDRKYETVDIAL